VRFVLPALILGSLIVIIPSLADAEAKTISTDSYTVEIPNGCKVDEKENRFTTTDATVDCKGDVSMRFESGETITDMLGETDDEIMDNMLSGIDYMWNGANEVERGADKYVINNQTAPYVIATYTQEFINRLTGLPVESEPWVYMTVAFRVGDQVMIASYWNNEESFDRQLPMFERVLKTIKATSPIEQEPQQPTQS
jgi:hypothetical protein